VLCNCIFRGWKLQKRVEISVVQVQVNYQTKEQYIVANILKYRSDNLIIFYCYAYSGLSDFIRVIVWNSMELKEIHGLVLRLMDDRMEFDLYWKRVERE